jgi:hypothetical protein
MRKILANGVKALLIVAAAVWWFAPVTRFIGFLIFAGATVVMFATAAILGVLEETPIPSPPSIRKPDPKI